MHGSSPSNHGAGDARTQRHNMVESQIRPSDVTDRRIIRAMTEVSRETFVPAQHRAVAYMDNAVPLVISGEGRVVRSMLAPRTLAKMIQLARIEPDNAVLDIGTATGYTAVVLSHLARKVVAVESDLAMAELAKAALATEKIRNASIITGPLNAGSRNDGPFDAIVVEGAVNDVSQDLLDQLKEGGRLVAILAKGAAGKATVWSRSHGSYTAREDFDATAGTLPGFEKQAAFIF